jgi:hypothetical protein
LLPLFCTVYHPTSSSDLFIPCFWPAFLHVLYYVSIPSQPCFPHLLCTMSTTPHLLISSFCNVSDQISFVASYYVPKRSQCWRVKSLYLPKQSQPLCECLPLHLLLSWFLISPTRRFTSTSSSGPPFFIAATFASELRPDKDGDQ